MRKTTTRVNVRASRASRASRSPRAVRSAGTAASATLAVSPRAVTPPSVTPPAVAPSSVALPAVAVPTFRWKTHLLRDDGARGGLVLLVVGAACWIAWRAIPNACAACFVDLVFVASLADYLFPVTYVLDDAELVVKTLFRTRISPWSMFRSCFAGSRAVLLCTVPSRAAGAGPGWIGRLRGQELLLAGADREAVLAFVRAKVAAR